MALLALGITILVLGLPGQFAYLQIPCIGGGCGQTQQLAPSQIEELRQLGFTPDFYAVYAVGLILLTTFVFVSVAAIIFWRKSDDRMALYCAFMLLAWGFGGQASGFSPSNPILNSVVLLFQAFGNSSIALFFFIFPNARFVPRWTRWFAPLAVLREVLNVYVPNDWVNNSFFVFVPFLLALQVYRYRRVSDPVQQQQTKWVVYGITAGVTLYASLLLTLILSSSPGHAPGIIALMAMVTALSLCLLFIPVSIGMAIVRSHLWDIDLIIRRTLVYSVLTAILALLYFGSVVALQELFRTLTGQGSDAAIILSTLAIAALFNPLRGRVQNVIDHRFYRRKYDAQKVLAQFGATARDEVDLNRLSGELIAAVDDTMQPASTSLWLREAGVSRPVKRGGN